MEGTTKINLRAAAAAQPSMQTQGTKFRVHPPPGSPGASNSGGVSSLAAAGLTATAMSASSVLAQQQIILRLPDELAERLRKILSSTTKKDHHDKGKRHASATATASSSSSSSAGTKEKSDTANVVTDLLIDVQPQGNDNDDVVNPNAMPSNKYIFTFQQDRYYAMLANLPTNVETHKTFDKKVFVKVADVGQMLVVYPSGSNLPQHSPSPVSLSFNQL